VNLPGLLIIGGMKCGSTTLYRDLGTSPSIFFPLDKEPGNLTRDDVLTEGGLRAYASMFDNARPGQICAEASTNYTKRPTFEGVAERAHRVLGSDLKLIYIIRNPRERISSHINHALANGEFTPAPQDQLIAAHPELLQYTAYAHQIEPWLDRFGTGNIRVVRFDDYTSNRRERCVQLWEWMGAEPNPDAIDEQRAFNASSSKPVAKGPFGWVPRNPVYRRVVRPMLSNAARDRVRHALLPKNRVERVDIGDSLARVVIEDLREEPGRMASISSECLLGPDVDWESWYMANTPASEVQG